jgi:hypothetical protein
MSINVLARYPKERLLEAKQTPICVGDLPKKLAIRDKIEPLSFQRVGLDSGQRRVTWLGHFILPLGIGKCQFQHVLLHLEE